MRKTTGLAMLAIGWLMVEAGPAAAAWNNVFQTCCNSCNSGPVRSSFFAPAPSPCCPTVTYQQRCCYQPYTAYRQETVLEPVTTYRTSYFWEPCTSYRYTSYYDPCTGCCQQVATPVTSYKLRSQCNAVQSYVQRCQMVPYTAYRQSCYLEPVTCPAPSCPTACPTCPTASAPAAAPAVSETAPGAPVPNGKPTPGISEDPDRIPKTNIPNRLIKPNYSTPQGIDRTASLSNGRLHGTILSDDRITPKGNTKIMFASLTSNATKYSANADASGRFAVELPAGDWEIYMTGSDGQPVYHSQITMKRSDERFVTVVSR